MDRPGRPSLYEPAFAEQAFELCLAGATNQDLAATFEVGPQHDRQLAAETPRIRPVGEAGTRSRRRSRRARPLFARRRLYLRDHPGRAPPRRAGVGAPDGAQAAGCSGRHHLAAQPPSAAMARRPQAAAGRGTEVERLGRGVRAGASCRRGRSCRINLGGLCFRTRAVRAGAR
jgi:hypothetical protein